MRVLLVDDHALFRDGMASLLAARGIQVVGEASDGTEAVAKVRETNPDVVLMDINMPKMGGLEATRLIKAEMPDVRIIMLTVSDEEQDLFEAIKSGAQGYLLKNLESGQFFELLSGISRGDPAITPAMAAKILQEFARQSEKESKPGGPGGDLTDREIEVLRLVIEGASNREIGEALFIAENTVKYHLKNILSKLHVQNRAQVVAYAMRHGLIRDDK